MPPTKKKPARVYATAGPYAKLQKIAAKHEAEAALHTRKAAILRAAIVMLNEHASASSLTRAEATIKGAIRIDASRRGADAMLVPNPRSNGIETKARRRAATATFLSHFDHETPRTHPASVGKGLGTLIRHGYLKKKSDGYIRTAKVYEP